MNRYTWLHRLFLIFVFLLALTGIGCSDRSAKYKDLPESEKLKLFEREKTVLIHQEISRGPAGVRHLKPALSSQVSRVSLNHRVYIVRLADAMMTTGRAAPEKLEHCRVNPTVQIRTRSRTSSIRRADCRDGNAEVCDGRA